MNTLIHSSFVAVGLSCFLTILNAQAQPRFTLATSAIDNGLLGGASRFSVIASQDGTAEGHGDPASDRYSLESGYMASVSLGVPDGSEAEKLRSVLGVRTPPVLFGTELVGPVALNPTSGLWEQRVRIKNDWITRSLGTTFMVAELPPGVSLFNPSALSNGIPFIDYGAVMTAGSQLDLLLQFQSPTNLSQWTPALVAVAGDGYFNGQPSIAAFRLTAIEKLSNNILGFSFPGLPDVQYRVQYSTDLSRWEDTAANLIPVAPGRYQLDSPALPNTTTRRFFRLLQLNGP